VETRYRETEAASGRGASAITASTGLRIQHDRMYGHYIPSVREYFTLFGLTPDRMRHAASDAIVMHPGPMNRGIEIDSAVADAPYSVILEQVANGIAVRMAVLYLLSGRDPNSMVDEHDR
jgi:aspartate carbamoyltransferase catalytic subunit